METKFVFEKGTLYGSSLFDYCWINLRNIYGDFDLLIRTITHENLHALIYEANGITKGDEEIVTSLETMVGVENKK